VGNLESVLTQQRVSRYARRKKYIHWSDPDMAAPIYAENNIRIMSLANNHSMDFDHPGLKSTLAAGDRHGIEFFGAGSTPDEAAEAFELAVDVADQQLKLAIFPGFEFRGRYQKEFSFYATENSPGVSVLDQSSVERITNYRKHNPEVFIIVYPHWGKNYKWRSTDQQKLAHELIDAGANLILGHGAHRAQEVERYKGQWIVYNLGNFMFNSPGRYQKLKQAPISFAAMLELGNRNPVRPLGLRIYPLITDNRVTKYQSRPVTGDEFATVQAVIRGTDSDVDFSEDQIGRDELGWFFTLPIRND